MHAQQLLAQSCWAQHQSRCIGVPVLSVSVHFCFGSEARSCNWSALQQRRNVLSAQELMISSKVEAAPHRYAISSYRGQGAPEHRYPPRR